jgi:hypothetical protein
MANSIYNKYYKDQPPVFKGIINVIVVGGLAYLGYELYKGYQNKQDIADANKAAADADQELLILAQRGVNPSYDSSQYEDFSQAIVEASNGCGTDETAIYNVFRNMHNDADIKKLISVFGVRYYQPCAASQPISYLRWQLDDHAFGGSLPTFIAYELDSSEIATINSILTGNNITYQF